MLKRIIDIFKQAKSYIKKVGEEWCVYSENGKNMGCFPTEKQAKKRLQQIHFFKNKK